jgi:hypothetical protein
MDGMNPAAVTPYTNRVVRPIRRAALRVVATLGVGAAVLTVAVVAPSLAGGTLVEIAKNAVGMPPADFQFAVTGQGEPGQWTLVSDQTAATKVAIEYAGRDSHEDRFPLAIYNPVSVRNAQISVRMKIVAGTMRSAGIAARLRDRDN